MRILPTKLPEVVLIEPRVHRDARGSFAELWRRRAYADLGLPAEFVQDNVATSQRDVLRGLHFQHPGGQGKLVFVLHGAIFDVAVDIRRGSPDFGRWTSAFLSADDHRQLYVPAGFAHGYCVIGASAVVAYKCTAEYAPECERSIRWNDPALRIDWPIAQPGLSPKDASAPLLSQLAPGELPVFAGAKAA